ncbi:MAG: hypothetical protein ACKO65_05345 [Betaproteobacteria bacterium]
MNQHHPEESPKPALVGKRPSEHVWTPGADVQSVWKKFGWTPPSKKRADTPLRERPAANHALRVLRG